MKRKASIAIVGTLVLVFGVTLTGLTGNTEKVNPAQIYGTFVDNYIQKCEAKADMLDSGSLNIRKSAMQSTLKGAFLQSNRTAMINHLVENNVSVNAHRIEYHLTREYIGSVHPQEIYALLLKERVVR